MVLNPADRKLDYARDLALALGYLALGSDDPVAFSVLTSRSASRTRAACAHRGRISSIRDFLDTAPGGGVADLPAAAARVVGENPGRQGTAVILSDFLYAEEEFRSALRLLLGHGIQVAAIHILGPSEWDLPAGKDDLVEVRDVETGRTRLIAIREDTLRLYRQSIAAHERRLRAFAFGLRAWYALFDPRARDGAAYLETFTRRHLPGMGLIRGKI
jgi:uncharacterized protein (DUF58 family)